MGEVHHRYGGAGEAHMIAVIAHTGSAHAYLLFLAIAGMICAFIAGYSLGRSKEGR